jgi:hypothetical protein
VTPWTLRVMTEPGRSSSSLSTTIDFQWHICPLPHKARREVVQATLRASRSLPSARAWCFGLWSSDALSSRPALVGSAYHLMAPPVNNLSSIREPDQAPYTLWHGHGH